MLSIPEVVQIGSLFDYFDYHAEFRIDNQLHYIDIHSMEQIFLGEQVSIKKAIDEKKSLQWLLDIGENHQEDFHQVASLSLSWESKENECYIGNLWIQPEFRGNGLSTLIFNELVDYADELGIVLTLHAIPFKDPTEKPTVDDVAKLINYYKRFGFKKQPIASGITFNSRMIRFPQANN